LQATPGHVVAVTHPFVIRAALTYVLHGSAFNLIDVEPLSSVELRFQGCWRLRLAGAEPEEDADEKTTGHRHRCRQPRLHYDSGGEGAEQGRRVFLMDKGQSKDTLIDLRRDICERYITDRQYRFVEARSPERERGMWTTRPVSTT
jgi:hypothetical protein